MTKRTGQKLRLDQPATYRIQIQGRLDETWQDWFGNTAMSIEAGRATPVTTLISSVADQSDLHGVLARIRDIGLPLLLVQYMEHENDDECENPRLFDIEDE